MATFQKAVYLWMPSQNGGSGIGQTFIDSLSNGKSQISMVAISVYQTANATTSRVNWKLIAFVDGAGAAGVLLRTWYLADLGPLGWGTILYAIGFGAAWSSGTAILGQLMLK